MRKGWEVKKLGEVCRFINGRAYSKPELLDKGKYAVLRVGNFFTNNHWYYSDLELDPDKYCDNGDLLYAWSASFGPRIWEGDKVIYHYHIWKVVPDPDIITKAFLYRLLEWDTEMIKSIHGTGTTMMHVGKGSIESRLVPVPPITEQQRIVTILDEAFEAIDQAKANTEKNLQNAKELFQSELNSIFTNKGEGWVERKLKDITTKIGSGATPLGGEQSYKKEGISLIRSLNVHDDGFRIKNLALIDDDQASKLSNVEVQSGDVLLNITGASVARCTVVPEDILPARVNQHVSIIRPKKDILHSRFLHFALTSKINKAVLLGIGEQGSTRQAITKAQIESFVLAYPYSFEEQNHIIYQLDTLSVETKQLEENYRRKLDSLEELKKSILQKAFSGELTRQTTEIEMEQLDLVAEDQANYHPNR